MKLILVFPPMQQIDLPAVGVLLLRDMHMEKRASGKIIKLFY